MTKEAAMFFLVVAASLTELVHRWNYSVLLSDANIGGMTATLFHAIVIIIKSSGPKNTQGISNWTIKATRMYKFEFAASSARLGSANIEMEPLGLTIRCEY